MFVEITDFHKKQHLETVFFWGLQTAGGNVPTRTKASNMKPREPTNPNANLIKNQIQPWTKFIGPARVQNGKIGHSFLMFLILCSKTDQKFSRKSLKTKISKNKSLRSHIVGQKCQKKEVLRMGLPGTQNLS